MIKRTIKKIVNLVKSPKLVPIVQTVPDSELLKGKVALITGGSGGIGMAIAARFLAAGAKVIIAGTNDEKLARCCAQLGSEENVKSTMEALESAEPFIRAKINEKMRLRRIPNLQFVHDTSIEYSIEISKKIAEVTAKDRENARNRGEDPDEE